MKLNARQVDTAKPREKAYQLADGAGLYLEVVPSGSRYWRMKYRFNGKEKRMAGNDSNLLIVFYVQIMPDDFVMQLHRF